MRILAFNHFFDQDLDALGDAIDVGDRLDVVPYQRVRRLARRHFPDRAFTAVAPAYESDMTRAWASFVPQAERMADWLATAYEPSIFITPSDAFFYLRPLIERFRALDVPTVVVQKETTISPMIMEQHSAAVGRTVPFISEAMTVCSERHRQFWLRAGADPTKVIVTGQPRFDVYASGRRPSPAATPTLLYLSYDDVAYLPSDTGIAFEGTWRELRRSTEEALAGAAQRRTWRVIAKRHPQQQTREEWLGPAVSYADRDADTRDLILSADAVIGFQTTGLLEAAAAGRPVIYAAWGPLFDAVRSTLIPFHAYDDVVTHADSLARLDELLRTPPSSLAHPGPGSKAIVEEHLGPIDGQAAMRTLSVLRRLAGRGPNGAVPAERRAILAALAKGPASAAVSAGAPLLGIAGRDDLRQATVRRATQWRQEAREGLVQARVRR